MMEDIDNLEKQMNQGDISFDGFTPTQNIIQSDQDAEKSAADQQGLSFSNDKDSSKPNHGTKQG